MINNRRKIHTRLKQKGIATMLTAFSMLMLVPIVGLAIDGGLAYIVMSRLSAAADSAALAAARGLNGSSTVAAAQAQATALATTFFNGNFPVGYLNTDSTAANRTVNAVFTLGTGSGNGGNGVPNGVLQVQVTASVKAATYFMKWLGYSNLPVNATGTATRRILVMTLVLDKSASMGTRTTTVGSTAVGIGTTSCDAMVYSAIQFLNSFSPYDYIGILPFDYTAFTTYPPTTNYRSANGAAQQIANINCGNNTNTTAALELAYRQIAAVNLPLANNVIVLFTDGVPNGINATFPVRNRADVRLASSCTGTDSHGAPNECQVPACTAVANATVTGVVTQTANFDVNSGSLAGPFKMFDSDSTPTVPANVASTCPTSGTDFVQKTLAYIPATDYFGNSTSGPWNAWLYSVNPQTAPNGTPITSGNSATKNMGAPWANYPTTGVGRPSNFYQSAECIGGVCPYQGQFRPDLANTIGVTSMNTAVNEANKIRNDTTYRIPIHTIYLQGNGSDPVDRAFLQIVSNQPTIAPLIYDSSDSAYANAYYNSAQQQGLWLATTSASSLNGLFAQVASSLLRISQ
jgi:Flp pilus assembly protein TadG